MRIDVTVEKNKVGAYKAAASRALENALIACGMEAETTAKTLCRVDTGRLRNSITFATKTHQSQSGGSPAKPEDYAQNGSAKDGEMWIGTNVEYGGIIEDGSSMRKAYPYLKPSLTKNTSKFKELVKAAYEAENP